MVRLKTERLILRPLKLSDEDDIYSNIKSKEVLKYMRNLNYPYDKKLILPYIKESLLQLKKGDSIILGICLKKTDKVIGMINLYNINRDHHSAKIGYWLGKEYWRKGITSEAITTLSEYGFNTLKLHRIGARLNEANIASKNILEKHGFILEGIHKDARYKYGRWCNELSYAKINKKKKK